ncbi:PIN domain-containing protein [Pararobbsia silviterrae]|uniref:PIN domain-containing protein n=1 Tax=Pararobbsia silviterrae TaxID=1792498 RepID=A0A494Y442_9BURK|nr:PIN domain-containing protein [Pararobbsia silviterrae]RKP57476.1 PIN domain-containing protein [Pararobbsia silviterrae]
MTSSAAERRPRVVLDSNVWIDILVFDDPATRPIASALTHARIDAVIDARCRAELARVLDYPQFERFAIDKAAALAQVDAWTTSVALPAPSDSARDMARDVARDTANANTGADEQARASVGAAASVTTSADPNARAANDAPASTHDEATRTASQPIDARPLPQCRDRDDQKFLELAHRARADWLVSKDRELLRMAKRIARDFGFSIGLPAAFVDARRGDVPSTFGN